MQARAKKCGRLKCQSRDKRSNCGWTCAEMFQLVDEMFLGLPKSNISFKITGNRVNRVAGNGLEIPCEYFAEGDRRAVNWLEKRVSSKKILVKSLLSINSEGRSRKRKATDS